MYYYVREPTPRDRERKEFEEYQGFVEEAFTIWNQSFQPMVFIDGHREVRLTCDDKVQIKTTNGKHDIVTVKPDLGA